MKSNYLLIFFLQFACCTLFSQAPANDNCSGATPIVLGTPAPCGTGTTTQFGQTSTVNGNITNATPGNPYIYQSNCTGAGGPNQSIQANDVWYSFVATGYQCVISINSTFANPNISFYSGNCSALGGGVGGCAVGSAGTVSLTINQLVPGTTYYLQVSGNVGQVGTFTLNIKNNIDCAKCLVNSNIVANPPPINGAYAPNTTVNFCFHVSQFNTINTNWLHGVQLSFGSGWNPATIVPNVPVPVSTMGNWAYYPNGIGVVNGQNWGPGWYFDSNVPNPLNGNPSNNFGDNMCGATPGCADISTAAQWNFCFSITTKSVCSPGSNLSVTFNTSGDGESGIWNNAGCVSDNATVFNAVGSCCPPIMSSSPVTCVGPNTGSAIATPVGNNGPYTYNWQGPAAFSSNSLNISGPSSITNVPAGIYTLTIIDNNLCAVNSTVQVAQYNGPIISAAFTTPSFSQCINSNSFTFNSNYASGTHTYLFNPTAGAPVTGNSANYGPISFTAPGTYTVTHLVTDFGCSATSSSVVVINPTPVVSVNSPSTCVNQPINLTANGGVNYSWTGPAGFSSNLQNPFIANATLPMNGEYTVVVSNNFGCVNFGYSNVVVNPLPVPSAVNSGPVCMKSSISFTASGGNSYSWIGPNNFNSLLQIPTINTTTLSTAGIYTVIASALGCTASATTSVTILPLPVPTIVAVPACVGQVIYFNGLGGITYLWNGPAGFVSTLQNPEIPFATKDNDGIYLLTISDVNGCQNSATYTLNVYPKPNAEFSFNPSFPVINEGMANVDFTDNSNGATISNWNWYFNSTNQFQSAYQNPSFQYKEAGQYLVTLVVKSNQGCSDTITKPIIIGDDFGIYVPNVFTPNEDGVNDKFEPKGFGIINYTLRVFDRWGEQLYYTDDFFKGWDGYYKNTLSKEDTYVWIINVSGKNNKSTELKGHVTLIK